MIEERQIYLSEVGEFFRKNQRKILLVGVSSFLLTLVLLLSFLQPHFRAEASFRQAQSQGEETSSVESILKSMRGFSEESSASSVMESRTLLGKVVEERGLQVVPASEKRLKMLLTRKEEKKASFREVDYRGESRQTFFVKALSEQAFDILDAKKKKVGEGEVGAPVCISGARFIVERLSKAKRPVKFHLIPKRQAIGELAEALKIKASGIDASILHLRCDHRVREQAIGILDCLMAKFQEHLREEHEILSNEQIAYLQKRQEQLGGDYEKALDAHVAYLQDALGVDGFLGLSQEVEMLSEPKEEYTAKRHQLDLDAKQWRKNELQAHAEYPWKEGLQKRDSLEWQGAHLHPTGAETEMFSGLDLETANKIYTGYNLERDRLNTHIEQLEAYREKLDEPDFEMSALSAILTDPVSQKLIEKGLELSIKLADTGNWSAKERVHLQEALEKQKKYIGDHILKQSSLLRTQKEVIEDKMGALQQVAMDLINREKGIIDEKLDELKDKMGQLPDKWRLESRLKMKKELIMQIIEGLTQLSESKVIGHHLFHVESKPIDRADAPMEMRNPHLIAFASMGGVLGAFFASIALFIRAIYRGLPVSVAYLRSQGYPFFKDRPDTLKKIALNIGKSEKVALIGRECAEEMRCIAGEGATIFQSLEKLDSVDALSLLKKADHFILFIKEEKVENLSLFPKEKTVCVLLD